MSTCEEGAGGERGMKTKGGAGNGDVRLEQPFVI
jgi:hypothetical protein